MREIVAASFFPASVNVEARSMANVRKELAAGKNGGT
jgi:hypothetical protein